MRLGDWGRMVPKSLLITQNVAAIRPQMQDIFTWGQIASAPWRMVRLEGNLTPATLSLS